jgi:hypothetical protein
MTNPVDNIVAEIRSLNSMEKVQWFYTGICLVLEERKGNISQDVAMGFTRFKHDVLFGMIIERYNPDAFSSDALQLIADKMAELYSDFALRQTGERLSIDDKRDEWGKLLVES